MSRAALVSLKGNKEVGGWGINGVGEGVSMQSLGGGAKLGKKRCYSFGGSQENNRSELPEECGAARNNSRNTIT